MKHPNEQLVFLQEIIANGGPEAAQYDTLHHVFKRK